MPRIDGASDLTRMRLDAIEWQERVLVEHPLVGKLYALSKNTLVDPSELLSELRQSRFVLLGEKHDNRDHHQLQATLLGQILAHRRDVAVAFEMFDLEQQDTVDAARRAHPVDVDALGIAVDWEHSGWPDWAMYRPLFATAFRGRARIVAANLSRARARSIMHTGASPIPIDSLPVLPPEQTRALEHELSESHCGMLPEHAVIGMTLAQRVRDWTMAERLRQANRGSGAVLIAGAEHVRRDRGVPIALSALNESAVLSVAMLEVRRGETEPSKYVDVFGDVQPFDFVIFTPRVDESDPCERMRSGG